MAKSKIISRSYTDRNSAPRWRQEGFRPLIVKSERSDKAFDCLRSTYGEYATHPINENLERYLVHGNIVELHMDHCCGMRITNPLFNIIGEDSLGIGTLARSLGLTERSGK